MPEKRTLRRAERARRSGKAPTTQAGAFVREEMEHMKEGKHPNRVRSRKQAIAIGLSKARRSGIKLPHRRAGSAGSRSRSGQGRSKSKRR